MVDRATLARLRDVLESEAAALRRSLDRSSDDAAPVELNTSIGRLSRMDAIQSQQMTLELRRRQETQLTRIVKALARADQGTYGTCIKCRQPIATERLEAQPDAPLCVSCAARLSKR